MLESVDFKKEFAEKKARFISHEIKNQLSVINLYAKIMEKKKLEKGEYGESVLIESYNNLPTATWNDIYDLLFNYLKQNLEAEVIKDLERSKN